jgi:hypothetical protein
VWVRVEGEEEEEDNEDNVSEVRKAIRNARRRQKPGGLDCKQEQLQILEEFTQRRRWVTPSRIYSCFCTQLRIGARFLV